MRTPSNHSMTLSALSLVLPVVICAPQALGQFNEMEPNTSRAQANVVNLSSTPNNTTTFNQIRGRTTGQSYTNPTPPPSTNSPDTFLFRLEPLAAGIYQHTVSYQFLDGSNNPITPFPAVGLAGGLIRAGSNNSGAAPGASGFTNARGNNWYSYGAVGATGQDSIYYTLGGGTSTNNDYLITYSRTQVTPITMGAVDTAANPGPITITTRGVTSANTDIILLDGNYAPLRWNEDSAAGFGGATSSINSTIIDSLAPGVYYVGVSTNLVHTGALESLAQGENNTANTQVADFAGSLFAHFPSVPAGGNDYDLRIQLGSTVLNGVSQNSIYGGVSWYAFEVIPTPSAAGLMGLAVLGMNRRRR